MVTNVIELSDSLDALAASLAGGDTLALDFGEYVLENFKGASSATDPTKTATPTPTPTPTNNFSNSKKKELSTKASGNAQLNTFFSKLNDLGITLDIVENPLNLIQLFLGQDIDLVTWDAPELDLGFKIEQQFPIFAGIRGLLQGDFSAKSDLVFGFDTLGLSEWQATGFAPEESYRIFDGFYLSDVDPLTGEDVDELQLEATISAGVKAGGVGASIEATGGIIGNAGFDVIDVGEYTGESDGRVRGSEILSRISNPTELFELAGALEAFLNIAVKIGVDLGFWKVEETVYERELARVTLFEFALGGDSSGTVSNGFIEGATVFFDVNFNGIQDESEPVTITDAAGGYTLDIGAEFDLNGDGIFDETEGRIVAEGGTDILSGLELDGQFFAPAGASVVTPLTSLVQQLIEDGLSPDEAERLVKQSFNVSDAVDLGEFNAVQEILTNNADGIAIYGNHIQIHGLFNITRQFIGEYLTSQNITVDAQTLQEWTIEVIAQGLQEVGAPTSAENLAQYIPIVIEQLETLVPPGTILDEAPLSEGLSGWTVAVLKEFETVENVIEGIPSDQALDSIETVKATIQKDLADVLGELGRDEIALENLPERVDQLIPSAPPGDPKGKINFGAENTFNNIRLQFGTETAFGNNADNQILGNVRANLIAGSGGNDTIKGEKGDDRIFGDGGDDQLYGGDGNDFVFGGAGNDTIDGGEGDDDLPGGFGDDSISGGLGNDFLDGLEGDDTLDGGAGTDNIKGWSGNDVIIGGEGADTLDGGEDADIFVYSSAGDSPANAPDTIVNFEAQDKIDLRQLGDHLRFIGDRHLRKPNQIRFADGMLEINLADDPQPELRIALPDVDQFERENLILRDRDQQLIQSEQENSTSPDAVDIPLPTENPDTYTLQILHAADLNGGSTNFNNIVNFAALVDGLEDQVANSITLSAGDNYIPGSIFNVSQELPMREALLSVYQQLTGENLTAINTGAGHYEITAMNIIGFDASAVGNHEFDFGSDSFADIIRPAVTGDAVTDIEWLGAQFPYLATNLDFSQDNNLSDLATTDILSNTEFVNTVTELIAGTTKPKLAPATVIEEGGEKIGIVSVANPRLEEITSADGVTVIGDDTIAALVQAIQPTVDSLLSDGINKIVLLSDLPGIEQDQRLVQALSGIDVVITGSDDTIGADNTDILRPEDTANNSYPIVTTDANGDTTLIVTTNSQYEYLGRLLVDFDDEGRVLVNNLDSAVNGAYATTDATVAGVWQGSDPLEAGSKGALVKELTDSIRRFTQLKDSRSFAETAVDLNGFRVDIRTEETNLGNLVADAYLSAALTANSIGDSSVAVAIVNAGTVRTGIDAGKLSPLDVESTLPFDNELVAVTVGATGLKALIEHGLSQSGSGGFPQISGLKFSYDPSQAAGEQVQSLVLVNDQGQVTETLVESGSVVADETFRLSVVTSAFLADGGDGYPFPEIQENIQNLGITEQGAFTDYLTANYGETPFAVTDSPQSDDMRIQNLSVREDTVLVEDGSMNPLPTPPDDAIAGTSNADVLRGNRFDSYILGLEGDDNIRGFKGDDTLDGGSGADTIRGNRGDDIIGGFEGSDRLLGGRGDDFIYGGAGDDTLRGQGGNDTLQGDAGSDWLSGDTGTDILLGGQGDDILSGGVGNDDLSGNEGADTFRFTSALLDGIADTDIIRDYQAEDNLNFRPYLKAGGSIASTRVASDHLRVELSGEDRVNVFGDQSALDAIENQLSML